MLTAFEAKRMMEEAHLAHLAKLEARAADWVRENVADKIEDAAKQGHSFVTVMTHGALPSMKIYINEILRDGGYKYEYHRFDSITIRWN